MDDHGDEPLVRFVRSAWQHLSDPGARFASAPNVRVPATRDSRLCPQGWCGIVTIGEAVLATAPDREQARALEHALNSTLAADHGDVAPVVSALAAAGPLHDLLGPAHLAYRSPSTVDVALSAAPGTVRTVAATDRLVRALAAGCPTADVAEAGIDAITSPAFVVAHPDDPEGEASAVAGYEHWPSRIAHVCVLTRPAARGAGLARAVAAAATEHAHRAGLVPQWRARPGASVRVARALGYRFLGQQVSLRLAESCEAAREESPPTGPHRLA